MTKRETVSMQVMQVLTGSMGHTSHSTGATALEDVRLFANLFALIGFILQLQMRRKNENLRKKKTAVPETGAALTPVPGKEILKSEYLINQ